MGNVTTLPTKFRRPSSLTPRQIWDAADGVTELMAWEVCPYLRNLEACEGCPEYETETVDGEQFTSKRGCRALAEEACRVMLAAKAPTSSSAE